MTGALIILLFTAAVGLLLWLLDRRKHPVRANESGTVRQSALNSEESAQIREEASSDEQGECCGQHLVCEKTSLSPFTTEAEYFEDEELDRFAGRPAEQYSPSESEEFREVLLTLKPTEVAAWARAMNVRGINLPLDVREELLMIVAEMRNQNS